MLYAFVIIIIVTCAGVLMNEGVFSAAVIMICAVFGGLIAFNYYEPVAGLLERYMMSMAPYADFVAILTIFSIAVTGLRLLTDQIAPTMIHFPDAVHRGGGVVLGAATGWIMAGILLASLQTLPLHRNFMDYNYRDLEKGNAFNPDRYWLAFVHRATGKVFDTTPPRYFDDRANYMIRYHLYRRTTDDGTTVAAQAEDAPENRQMIRSRSAPRP